MEVLTMTLLRIGVLLAMSLASVVPFADRSYAVTAPVNPADFSAEITNPLFPLSSLGPKVFEGHETDPETDAVKTTRLESRVMPDTATVDGVAVLILEERAFENGQLV